MTPTTCTLDDFNQIFPVIPDYARPARPRVLFCCFGSLLPKRTRLSLPRELAAEASPIGNHPLSS